MKKKPGRPPYLPNDLDRSKVKLMSMAGYTAKDIAENIGICKQVLYNNYKEDLQNAVKEANARVVKNLYEMTKTSAAAAIFWCKTRLHWRETDTLEIDAKEPIIKFEFAAQPEVKKK
jgi:hypothetical protein